MAVKFPILDRLGNRIADAGRNLMQTVLERSGVLPTDWRRRLGTLCDHILSGAGVASLLASLREIGNTYEELGGEERYDFLKLLNDRYKVDENHLDHAISAWQQADDPANSRQAFLQLAEAVETPRGKILRAINMAPGSTRLLVNMRADTLKYIREHPELELIEADLRHILSSWFNRGFLQLKRIEWTTAAAVLEKLFEYETVHRIKDWDDLKRRLESDRRIFAFFHPALADDPLIFIEVALVKGISDSIQDLLSEDKPGLPLEEVDTAIFYSINNAQRGLGGISFGSFLIKQVVDELQDEFPNLKTFATLSPLPRLRKALAAGLSGDEDHPLSRHRLGTLIPEDEAEAVLGAARKKDRVDGMLALLDTVGNLRADEEIGGTPLHQLITPALVRLTLVYLTEMKRDGSVFDPVARFHLANGARLERIIPFADTSDHGIQNSYGVMVNYLYDPALLERNHEAFMAEGTITLSPDLNRQLKAISKT